MHSDEYFMKRAIQIAQNGLGHVAPNPLVGAVIVHNNKIIGEGYHQKYGEAHAEINAINAVKDQLLLKESTIYVTLEPCSHYGKTPPCADAIIQHQFKRVVIGTTDPFEKVAGKGMKKIQDAGIALNKAVLEKECRFMNRRFITFQEKKRPYVILKFAQSADKFIDADEEKKKQGEIFYISNNESLKLVHKWRCEEDAILIGTNTALKDNPQLTTRLYKGKNPVRVVLDKSMRLPDNLNVKDEKAVTYIYNAIENKNEKNIDYIKVNWDKDVITSILHDLYTKNIQSLIVEGGAELLNSFLAINLWDEARIFTSETIIKSGVKAPEIKIPASEQHRIGNDILTIYYNQI
jgi:diaminohydroxyphosphoribosylaminopyrimidine deaminase / 5-amino-6-(5-phosphoribosylamino)uracil reductase